MANLYDIGEVSRSTGLTLRALRFYEARGLVTAQRTPAGRRVYGPAELARLDAAIALKRAGFTIRRIAELLEGRKVDLARVVSAQLAHVEAQAEALTRSRALLLSVQARLARGETIDVATICSLIRTEDSIMTGADWKPVIDDYFTPTEQARFGEVLADASDGFAGEAYGRRWQELAARIEAALPLAPGSDQAQAFVDEWFALLKPFSAVATPDMWNGVARMYDDMPNWPASPAGGFGQAVWSFIRAATNARLDAGGAVDGPAWAEPRR